MFKRIDISDIPKNPVERRAWVGYQLKIRGLSFQSLATKVGVQRSAITYALIGPSSHLEPVIAEALGLTAPELFPERFDAMGNRLAQTRPQKRNTTRVAADVQNGEAA